MTQQADFDLLLEHARSGDQDAQADLLAIVYDEIKKIAERDARRIPPTQSWQPTSLANEAAMRLLLGKTDVKTRSHFLAAAATTIRRILIEHTRRRDRAKHGAGWSRRPIDSIVVEASGTDESVDLQHLEMGLRDLNDLAPEQASVVEMRYFAGMTVEQVALVLDRSPRHVNRQWQLARAFLYERLTESLSPADEPGS